MVARRLLVFTTRARARVCLCKPKNKQAWPCSLRASPSSWTISDRQRPSARVRTSQSQAPRQEGIHQLGLRRLTAILGKGSSERASERASRARRRWARSWSVRMRRLLRSQPAIALSCSATGRLAPRRQFGPTVMLRRLNIRRSGGSKRAQPRHDVCDRAGQIQRPSAGQPSTGSIG